MNNKYYLFLISIFLTPFPAQSAARATARSSDVGFHVQSRNLAMVKRSEPLENEVSVKDGRLTMLSKEVCDAVVHAILHFPEAVLGAQEIAVDEETTFESPVAALTECQNGECHLKQNNSTLGAKKADMLLETAHKMNLNELELVYVRHGVDGLFPVLQDLVHLLQCAGEQRYMTKIRLVLIDAKYANYCTHMRSRKAKKKKDFTFKETANMAEGLAQWFESKGISGLHDELVQLMKFVRSQLYHGSPGTALHQVEFYVCSNLSSYEKFISSSSEQSYNTAKWSWKAQVIVLNSHTHGTRKGKMDVRDDIKAQIQGKVRNLARLPFIFMDCKVSPSAATYQFETFSKPQNAFSSVEQERRGFRMDASREEGLVWVEEGEEAGQDN